MQGTVAILMAAMNAEATIGRAVASALAQPETSEVWVVDDASRDGTAAAAWEADDGSGRLNVVRLEINAGPSAARNVALDRARAEWVAVLDADDLMLPGRLAGLLAMQDPVQPADLLADDLLLARPGAEEAPHASLGLHPGGDAVSLELAGFVRGNIPDPARPRAEYGFLKPLMRRDFLVRHGLRYDPALRLGEDYLLYAMALAHGGRLRLVPPQGYVAVVTAGSLSHRHGATDLRALAGGDDQLLALPMVADEARSAIEEHRKHIVLKALHREVLDARRRGDWRGALGGLFSSPGAARYILERTLRDKLARA